jgi:hypothetical protein
MDIFILWCYLTRKFVVILYSMIKHVYFTIFGYGDIRTFKMLIAT